MSTPRKHYTEPGKDWILVALAARLMGVDRKTVMRTYGAHVVEKLSRGRVRKFILLQRVRSAIAKRPAEASETPTQILELKAQMEALAESQITMARAIGKLAAHAGVRL